MQNLLIEKYQVGKKTESIICQRNSLMRDLNAIFLMSGHFNKVEKEKNSQKKHINYQTYFGKLLYHVWAKSVSLSQMQ